MTTDVGREVNRRAREGVRWILWITVVAAPMAFLTNTLLARLSPLALGYYGAVVLFSATFQTVGILGGPKLFTRFVPVLARRDRVPFLLSYSVLVLGSFLVVTLVAQLAAPAALASLLERFGGPSVPLAIAVAAVIVVMTFTSHFLFGVLSGPEASVVARLPVLGFFVAALLGATTFREVAVADPARYLWIATLAVFGASALLASIFAVRTEEFRDAGKLRWILPAGFWSALAYTHLEGIVVFVYSCLAPAFVLLWIDVAALAPFHAALRYVALFEGLAGLLSAALSPGLAALDSAGLRDAAFAQARRAMSTSLLAVVPIGLVLIFFAEDAMAVFGSQFRPRADLLRVLAVSVIAPPFSQFGGGMLVAFGAYRAYLVVSSVYVVAAIALVFALIPSLGLTGAAWAATASSLAHAAAVMGVLRYRLRFRERTRGVVSTGVLLAASAVATIVQPGRAVGAGLAILFLAAFVVAGRVTRAEVATALGGLRSSTRAGS